MSKNKTLAIAIALLLILTTGSAFLPHINTAEATTTFYAYIYVAPNPIGLGQAVNVGFGITMPTLPGSYYSGWIITVTDPSGKNQTLGPYTSDATGGTGTAFTPSALGTWLFQAYYPGGNITFNAKPPYPEVTLNVPPVYSPVANLTVQQTQLSYPPEAPLPTEYWQYPVYSDNQGWYQISGNWLMSGYDSLRSRVWTVSGVFDPYTTAPTTAHILWAEPWMFGGIAGTAEFAESLEKGYSGVQTYYTGANYREEVTPPLIINGRVYYNQVDPPAYGFYCIDLYTGKEIWFQNQTFLSGTGSVVGGTAAQLSLGQILTDDTVNQNGAFPFLWSISGTTWARYDAYSGNLLNTIVNATRGPVAQIFGPRGELLLYYFDLASETLALWNSSRVVTGLYNQGQRLNIPWKNGIQWNVTVPTVPGEGTDIGTTTWDPKNPTTLIITNQTNASPLAAGTFTDIAYSMVDGHELWSATRNTEGDSWELVYGTRAMGDGIYTNYRKETMQMYAYDAKTGQQMWVSEPRTEALGMFVNGAMFAYGKIYQFAYDGKVYAYDEENGTVAWIWYDNDVNPSGLETPYGQYPYYGSLVAADGLLFVKNQEHTEQSPLFRGEALYALNVTTGQMVWMLKGQFKEITIAGGIIFSPNMCDGQIYGIGKGPSKVTVTAPDVGVTTATPVTIRGTVTDVSAGSQKQVVAANFPNGLPCVSDASMSDWMQFVYEQQPCPANVTGVPVDISVLDSNGNQYSIGTAMSDGSGTYALTWTPEIDGNFTVYASFAGTGSYYPSSAETHFYASAAPAATPAPTPQPASLADIYFLPMSIVLLIAIIVAAIAIVLMLRKR